MQSDSFTLDEKIAGLTNKINNQQHQIAGLIRRLDLIEQHYFDMSMRLQSARLQANHLVDAAARQT